VVLQPRPEVDGVPHAVAGVFVVHGRREAAAHHADLVGQDGVDAERRVRDRRFRRGAGEEEREHGMR
jgi:hypothetical protein